MIAVLHTFGSDLKYHLHCHCLITFGGMKEDQWKWPVRKHIIAPYRAMCSEFRKQFTSSLDHLIKTNEVSCEQYEILSDQIQSKRWNVRCNRPTMNTKIIERYLARYINRIAISNNRVRWLQSQKKVAILFTDYRNQIENQTPPKAIRNLDPLVAIHQIVQHLLPPYFQKSRYYGLHSCSTFKAIKHLIPESLKRNDQTIRSVFQILFELLKIPPSVCPACQSNDLEIIPIQNDASFFQTFLNHPPRSPPIDNTPSPIV